MAYRGSTHGGGGHRVEKCVCVIGVDLFSRWGGGGVIGVPCEGAKRPSGGRVWEGHWRKSRGDGGMYPPLFWVGGMALYKYPPPPLFEDKITLHLTFIINKLTFLTVKLLKTPKIARSLRSLAHKCILRLDLCGFASTHVFFSWYHLCKERCTIKQALCYSMARKSIARATNNTSEGDMKISRRDYSHQWLKSKIPQWNIVISYALSHLCISNNTSEIWYIKINVLNTTSMM